MQMIVTKRAGDRQLAHLYEHIFLNALSDELRSDGYLSFLDYDISGIANKNGLIVLDLKFKDYLETKIKKILVTKKLVLSDNAIAAATLQIFAEKSVDSDGFDNKTIKALKQLDSQSWQESNLFINNDDPSATYDNFLNLYSVSETKFFRDQIEFIFPVNDANSQYLSLFLYLSRILVNSISEVIENDFYGYCLGVYDDFKSGIYRAGVKFVTSKRQKKCKKQKKEAILNLINIVKTDKVIDRMIRDLRESSKRGCFSVDLEKIANNVRKMIVGGVFQKNLTKSIILKTIDKISVNLN